MLDPIVDRDPGDEMEDVPRCECGRKVVLDFLVCERCLKNAGLILNSWNPYEA